MLHLAHQAALQPDQVARQQIVQDLAAAVGQQLVAKAQPEEHRVEMRAVGAFD